MKYLQNTPHLDPLPSSDEGRGNLAVSFKRTSVCVGERSARFPLPFGRGEDQGEGLVRQTFASLTKWEWGRGERKGDNKATQQPIELVDEKRNSSKLLRHSPWD